MKNYLYLFLTVLLAVSPAAARAAGSGTQEKPGEKPDEETAGELFQKLFGTLSVHGNAIMYYQWVSGGDIAGNKYKDENIAGMMGQLYLTWNPIENGELLVKIKYTQNGDDSQNFFSDALFSTVNESLTISHNKEFRFQKFTYTQNFFDGRLFIAGGKNDPESYIDLNEYANDENCQFMGQPFVDNPLLDDEDDYGPLIALGGSPLEDLHFVFLLQSTTWAMLEEEEQKSAWDDLFHRPFYGAQLNYAPQIGGRQGNYRLYGWNFSYDYPRLTGTGNSKRWGVGISVDQEVDEITGLFLRVGYQNKKVYEFPWFLSAGASLEGLVPSRERDILGVGAAGLFANPDTGNHGTEVHFEAYYRFWLSEYFAITPDLQYVLNPQGDSGNDNVFAGMLRGEFEF